MIQIIDDKLKEKRTILMSILENLQLLTKKIGHEKMEKTVDELIIHAESPFTFVIVGEVKAGKSSFVNALLETDKEICKVAVSPMTDTIQQIVYGETEYVESINEYIKKIYQPVEILKEIAIVDTPGTNTIVQHHQEITERYIPYSDLIVFVFEAKNPYRQSSWDFFNFINEEWRRKIIFVLQQKDLLSADDLQININGVIDHASKKGIENPRVFAVSAKDELEKNHSGSGFKDLREYIAENITGGKAPYLKFANSLTTISTINNKLNDSLILRQKQFELDTDFRNEIHSIMDHQEQKTATQIENLMEHLLTGYDNVVRAKQADLNKGLSFVSVLKRSFSSIFGSESSLKEWLNNEAKDLELKLHHSLKDRLRSGIMDVAENIQMMGKLVDQRIKTSETVLKNSDEIFADIAEKRIHVLRDLQDSFSDFMSNAENFYDESVLAESSKMAPNLAAGSGIAIVGVILAATVNGAVFDITGGVLTTIGVIFAGVTLGLNKSRIINRFAEEVSKGRTKIEKDVSTTLLDYTKRIKQKIDYNFSDFDRMLSKEGKTLEQLKMIRGNIDSSLESLKIK
ncbi:MAG: dynamin family protein [Saprospiraceae bacterium]|nr:dynamin family protein [Saprospiraceae bacterium]